MFVKLDNNIEFTKNTEIEEAIIATEKKLKEINDLKISIAKRFEKLQLKASKNGVSLVGYDLI